LLERDVGIGGPGALEAVDDNVVVRKQAVFGADLADLLVGLEIGNRAAPLQELVPLDPTGAGDAALAGREIDPIGRRALAEPFDAVPIVDPASFRANPVALRLNPRA